MQMARNSTRYPAEMMYEKFNELSERLREIRTRLPVAEQTLRDVRQKLARLNEKRHLLKASASTYN